MPFDNYGNYIPFAPYPQQQPAYVSKQNVYAFVNGLEGAKSYIVPANQTVLLMDSEQSVCYMKTANNMGQSTLRYFKLTEVKESDIKGPQPTNNYDDLVKRIEEIEKKLGDKNE